MKQFAGGSREQKNRPSLSFWRFSKGEGNEAVVKQEGERQRGQTKVLVEANLCTIAGIRRETEARHGHV